MSYYTLEKSCVMQKNFTSNLFVGCRFKVMELPRFLWLYPHSGAQNIFFHVHRDLFGSKNQNWSNSEVTIHPYVTYYCMNGEQHHLSLVIILEKLTHDASSVHLFNTRLVKYLKHKCSVLLQIIYVMLKFFMNGRKMHSKQ